ncbi:MAG: serine/threonine-protein kinase [Planctomycetota bacterium]|nr:serine/threonine-protein kinase [Planctomycetota bacterium]
MTQTESAGYTSLDEIVESFESTIADAGEATLERFLPDREHPEFREILAELLRVDLEHRWRLGQPESLERYRDRFSEAFSDQRLVADLAFEEFRLRRHAGEAVSRLEYAERFQIDVGGWPSDLRPGNDASGETAEPFPPDSFAAAVDSTHAVAGNSPPFSRANAISWEPATDALDPAELQPGRSFHGFEIVSELGRGAAARVYLARQRLLANRYVVLKVTSESTVEADRLARLQHTNIVPLYSYHQVGSLQILCMPFLGSCVLNQWVDHLKQRVGVPVTSDEFLTTFDRLSRTAQRDPDAPPSNSTGLAAPRHSGGRESSDTPASAIHRLRGRDYQETVLWITARLADGLAHAHEQGILHLDVKPANIPLNDDGQPMLLDFHLATASAPNSPAATAVGGTLPYMSPEQLDSLDRGGKVDARSDVYSLGVVLFELLTGQLPFPRRTGELSDVLTQMHADRQAVPRLLPLNPVVAPAVESLVRKCLSPQPGQRYQSAAELSEDLQLQLRHLPLAYASNPSWSERFAKWRKRHPRASSGGVVFFVAVAVLAAIGGAWRLREHHYAQIDAGHRFAEFTNQAPLIRSVLSLPTTESYELRPEITRAIGLLTSVGLNLEEHDHSTRVPDSAELVAHSLERIDAWRNSAPYRLLDRQSQRQLERDFGRVLFLLAAAADRTQHAMAGESGGETDLQPLYFNYLAAACFPEHEIPVAVWLQRAELWNRLGRETEAEAARSAASHAGADVDPDPGLDALRLVTQARIRESLTLLQPLRDAEPRDPSLWFLSGDGQLAMHEFAEAEASFTTCIALRPDWHLAWYQRGICRLQSRRYTEARYDFTRVLELKPDCTAAYVSRALACEGAGELSSAIDDVTRAIVDGFPETRLYFLRARIHARLGNVESAAADRAEGLRRTPTDARSWVARGLVRMRDEPEGALADLRVAITVNPREYEAYRTIAHVLSERLDRPGEAIEALDQELKLTGDDPLAWAGRGVLLARAGRQDEARSDAEQALAGRREPLVVYQAACIEALVSTSSPDRLTAAFALLREALRNDPALVMIAPVDPDLKSLHSLPEFAEIVAAARLLSAPTHPLR